MLLPVPPVTGVSTAKCDMYPKNCNGTVFNSTNLNFTSTPMVTTMNTAAMETTIGTEATQSLDDYLLVLIEFYPKASTSILNFQLINFTFDSFIYINARIYYDIYYFFRWIYRLSYLYYALFAVIISLLTGIIVTAISNRFTGRSYSRVVFL